jgi:GT2 family glycosyltransferase
MLLTVIILSKTDSDYLFEMTRNCIQSLLESEKEVQIEIILVESNKNFKNLDYSFHKVAQVIIPEENFNFHRFLNIGIRKAKGDWVALCNNDLIFYPNWFSEILKVKKIHPKIHSFSPNEKVDNSLGKIFEVGYKVRNHVNGWCIVVEKEIIKKINYLDERFNFNYADNDYALTLKKYNIMHAIVYTSHVKHLEKEIVKNHKKLYYEAFKKDYERELDKLPKYLYTEEYKWLLQYKKGLIDHLNFHNKWGNPKFLHRKNKIADILIKLHLGYLNRFFLQFKM